MSLTHDLRKAVRAVVGPMVGAALIVYFGLNAFHGDRGVMRTVELRSENLRAEESLRAARARRAYLEARVDALRSHRLDPDYLDERARLMTGFVGQTDIVLTGLSAPGQTRGLRRMVGAPPGFSR